MGNFRSFCVPSVSFDFPYLDFSLLDFKLCKTFLKLLTHVAKYIEEIWKIEGYTKDAKSPKVTNFEYKLG